jgi:hypothetical protein
VKVDVDNCSICQIPYEYLTPLQAAIGVVQKVRAFKHLYLVPHISTSPQRIYLDGTHRQLHLEGVVFLVLILGKGMCRDLGRGRGAILFKNSLLQVNAACALSRKSHLNTGLSFFAVQLFINRLYNII